jgi:hypothetical protein
MIFAVSTAIGSEATAAGPWVMIGVFVVVAVLVWLVVRTLRR